MADDVITDDCRNALVSLAKAALDVANKGPVVGPQWMALQKELFKAQATLHAIGERGFSVGCAL